MIPLPRQLIPLPCNGNISEVVGKRGRILGIVIFVFNTSFQNVNHVFVKIV